MTEPQARFWTPEGWRRLVPPLKLWVAQKREEVLPLLHEVARHGGWSVGAVAYEAAPAFDPALRVRPSAGPLAMFLLADQAELAPLPAPARRAWEYCREWGLAEFVRSFGQVHSAIGRGDTYQANLSFRLRGQVAGPEEDPAALLAGLVPGVPPGYSALLVAKGTAIFSLSPELFFRREGRRLESRPMKGTAPRGLDATQDQAFASHLKTDPKSRAENLMIVDMIRNDLGRIARPGSVQVPSLFHVEDYPTVLQMTSTVTGETDVALPEIFAAMFPCASVTGAPKVETMRLLAGLETSPRGWYCGAVGYTAPGGFAQFNVAIRTLTLDLATRVWTYGVGSGLVWDSQAELEYEECLLKARALDPPPPFQILESLLLLPGEGFPHLADHLDRLVATARRFGFRCDLGRIRAALDRRADGPQKVRLLLSPEGEVGVEAEPILPWPELLQLPLSPTPVDSRDPWLRWKTTRRDVYDARRGQHADVILQNERGELTETTWANLAVLRGGEWITPRGDCGLLPGTARRRLLRLGQLEGRPFREGILPAIELTEQCEMRVFNAVRGVVAARLTPAIPPSAT